MRGKYTKAEFTEKEKLIPINLKALDEGKKVTTK